MFITLERVFIRGQKERQFSREYSKIEYYTKIGDKRPIPSCRGYGGDKEIHFDEEKGLDEACSAWVECSETTSFRMFH